MGATNARLKKKSNMKVLELCLSTGVGGLEHYAIRTARQLKERGIECLAVVADNTMTAKLMREHGINTLNLKRSSRNLPFLAANRLAHIIDEQAIDVMHMHWSNDFALTALAKRFAKRPVKLIYTRQMMLTRPKHDFLHRFLYRHVDLLLTITNQLRDLAIKFVPMPSDNIQTLYYGVEKPALLDGEKVEGIRKMLGIPSECFSIGMVGRIEPGKGQYLLIDAVEHLTKKGCKVHASLIGPAMNDTYLDSLKQQVNNKGLSKEITFFGSHNNPVEIMSVFDVVVLATKAETFGLVLIEAMRNGVAVIGTNAGGVPEIIEHGETGLLFEPENVRSLEEALQRLIDDPEERERLARAGHVKAEKMFTRERHYDELIEKMQRLCR